MQTDVTGLFCNYCWQGNEQEFQFLETQQKTIQVLVNHANQNCLYFLKVMLGINNCNEDVPFEPGTALEQERDV